MLETASKIYTLIGVVGAVAVIVMYKINKYKRLRSARAYLNRKAEVEEIEGMRRVINKSVEGINARRKKLAEDTKAYEEKYGPLGSKRKPPGNGST